MALLEFTQSNDAGESQAPQVSVVLPCYNEHASVGACVSEALAAMNDAGLNGEVIVVDNNSTDGSAKVASLAGARVVSERRPGYGSALMAGLRSARADVIVMADADLTYPLDQLAKLVGPVLGGDCDIALGTRFLAGGSHQMPLLHRRLGTPVLAYLVRAGVGSVGLTDSQSGFRAFRRDTVLALGLNAPGMEFASEMLIRAGQMGLKLNEVPLGYRPRVGESKLSTWRDGWRHVRLIMSLNPHLLLWQGGLAASVMGFLLTAFMFLHPAGAQVGSLAWQPIFFAPLLLSIGPALVLGGALLAYHAPSTSPVTRLSFAWIAKPAFHRLLRAVGLLLVLGGVVLDALLFVLWTTHFGPTGYQRLGLAGLAQALFLSGVMAGGFGLMYPLVRESHSNGRLT